MLQVTVAVKGTSLQVLLPKHMRLQRLYPWLFEVWWAAQA